MLIKDADPIALERIERHREHFVRLARVEGMTAVLTVPEGAIQTVVDGATFVLQVAGAVDLGREKARLAKEIERLDTELGKIAAKLGNPGFLAKARPEIVADQREREAEASRDRDRLRAAYERLTPPG